MQTRQEFAQELPDWVLLLIFTALAGSSALYGSFILRLPSVLGLSVF